MPAKKNRKMTAKSNPKKQTMPTKKSSKTNASPRLPKPINKELVVVGIGASAGGLEAFEQFFTNMPADPARNMAFVLVQHLDPTHKSLLTDLLKRYTQMNVFEVEDGITVRPNCAYIIPPNHDMALLHGKLHLIAPAMPRGLRLPIDFFFRSLAQDQRERAVCIVLSGTGTDGTLGLTAVKGEGGLVMVQDPESAQYDGMPRSAIVTGRVDYVLPPDEMPAQLLALMGHMRAPQVAINAPVAPKNADAMQKIFILLRSQTGHDFSYYKPNTIHRRIERRMVMNQIEQLSGYVQYLQQTPAEIETLFRELLIGVTNFFRDPVAFTALEEQILPSMFANKPEGSIIRVWSAGCSTGEEAYSLAILLREQMDVQHKEFRVQIFATDIDSRAIVKARAGIYPNSIAADVTAERLQRFFRLENSYYHVHKTIRDMVIFAEHNVGGNPPFSKLDLLTCRNLLIYLDPKLQKQVISLFHYALNPDGVLFLGNSETLGEFGDLFADVDRKWKLYKRKEVKLGRTPVITFPPYPLMGEEALFAPAKAKNKGEGMDIRQVVEQTLLADYVPACAIVNERGEILYIHGHTGKYLEPAAGEATLNILRMARRGLSVELATGMRQVLAMKETIRYEGLRLQVEANTYIVNLIVAPIVRPFLLPGLMMIVFEDVPNLDPAKDAMVRTYTPDKDVQISEMERELRAKEEYLQTAVEELETANEELKSTNEELQSTNEELQSTNEELETSKEEMQSMNEELVTANAELQRKFEELSRVNNDMSNLMAGTGIATIFVDLQLHIQRFTPSATQIMHLIQTDVGRPVNHLVTHLAYNDLVKDTQAVLDTLIPKEIEVETDQGVWYLMRILPYRTLENVIDGAVLTFVQISQQKQTQTEMHQLNQQLQAARDYAENIVDTVRHPLLVLNADLKVVSANPAFLHTFKLNPTEVVGKQIYELDKQQWDIPQLRKLLEEILPEQSTFDDYEVTHDFSVIGKRTMLLNAREIGQADGKERLILLAIEDVTGKHI